VHGMVGHEAVVRGGGLVQVNGELWRARSAGGEDLVAGQHVRIEEVEEDLRLVVGSKPPPTGEEPA
jgi:membrane protein implicated in regulation of membrane protease activity